MKKEEALKRIEEAELEYLILKEEFENKKENLNILEAEFTQLIVFSSNKKEIAKKAKIVSHARKEVNSLKNKVNCCFYLELQHRKSMIEFANFWTKELKEIAKLTKSEYLKNF